MALDVGDERVGLAFSRSDVKLPISLKTLNRQDKNFWQDLLTIIDEHEIGVVVIGLPRGLDGQETNQTKSAKAFAVEFAKHTDVTISWQDEALTSVEAEKVLRSQPGSYNKSDIDALAARIILSDYLEQH